MKIRRMGTLPDCTDVQEVVIANESGMAAHIITYGAVIKNLKVPDENGDMERRLWKNTEGIHPAARLL